MYVCKYVCTYVLMYVCMYVRMYVCTRSVYTYRCVCTNIYACAEDLNLIIGQRLFTDFNKVDEETLQQPETALSQIVVDCSNSLGEILAHKRDDRDNVLVKQLLQRFAHRCKELRQCLQPAHY